jgi:nucleotide-binding universal stress UspA family protein
MAMKTTRSILIPTDFSEHSLVATEYMNMLSKSGATRIFLFHAIPEIMHPYSYPIVDLNSETMLRDSEEVAKEQLRDLGKNQFGNRRNVTIHVRRGEPWREIVKFAQENAIDLIVMATHGRTGFAHILMGSVAEQVVRHANVPVMTIKPETMQEPPHHEPALVQIPHGENSVL